MTFLRCQSNQPNSFKEFFDVDRYLTQADFFWPALDISEDKEKFTVHVDVPGLKKEDIHVTTEDNFLVIKGQRKTIQEEKEKNYHRVERSYGAFERRLDLGTRVDESKIKATYKDGVLEFVLPKAETKQAKQIAIEGN